MTIIWEILVFMLGLCLSVQVVGALFSLIVSGPTCGAPGR